MKKVLFFFAAISMLIACNNGTPIEAGCTLLTTSDGLYNLKTADGKKLKVEASSIKFYYDTFFRIMLPDGKQQFYVPATNYLSEPYEDVLYAGGGQFVVAYFWGSDTLYKGVIDMWGEEDISLVNDIFTFFSLKDQKYYYITIDYNQNLFEKWKTIYFYNNDGTKRFHITRDFPCKKRVLTERLEEGKPSQYETGLITFDEPEF